MARLKSASLSLTYSQKLRRRSAVAFRAVAHHHVVAKKGRITDVDFRVHDFAVRIEAAIHLGGAKRLLVDR